MSVKQREHKEEGWWYEPSTHNVLQKLSNPVISLAKIKNHCDLAMISAESIDARKPLLLNDKRRHAETVIDVLYSIHVYSYEPELYWFRDTFLGR